MDELAKAIAEVIEQYAGLYVVVSIIICAVMFLVIIGFFVYVTKSIMDADKEMNEHIRGWRRKND